MLTAVNPKLPMRNSDKTKDYYLNSLGFSLTDDYGEYLIVTMENIEIHFFLFENLKPKDNYGQIYIRTDNIDELFQSLLDNEVAIHPNGSLETKPWGQREFSLLDPDNNLLTFGQSVD